jgi:hypothetical protein
VLPSKGKHGRYRPPLLTPLGVVPLSGAGVLGHYWGAALCGRADTLRMIAGRESVRVAPYFPISIAHGDGAWGDPAGSD